MDTLLIIAVVALVILVAGMIWTWRQSMVSSRTQELELRERVSQLQTQVALGEEARRSLASAQTERTDAFVRASTAESKAAASTAELDAIRSRQSDDSIRARALDTEINKLRLERDQLSSNLATAREQVTQMEVVQSTARQAMAVKEETLVALRTAESARATAEAESFAARSKAMEMSARIEGLTAEIVNRDKEKTAQAEKLSESEALRGAAQSALEAAKESLTEQGNRLKVAVEQVDLLRTELSVAQTSVQRFRGDLSQSEALATERQQAQEQSREQLAIQLRALTQQLYEEQGKAMLGEGRIQLEQTLTPFRERLLELQARIDQVHTKDMLDRASLKNDLNAMLAAQTSLSAEAAQLGRALRADTKVQGTWGELTLQRLLESSQLERGLAYELQVPVRSDEGASARPDAVIFLPEQKALVIDAKVSLTAFLRATNAETEDGRIVALKEHLQSVRGHMRGLSSRDYPEAVKESLKGHVLDLTLMFMPSEAAFAAAITQDPDLWAEALRLRIIIVSPTTLLATLRVVAQIWRVEKQNRNAAAIAKEAGGIVEKIRGALDDFDTVERAIQSAQEAFGKARGKLLTGKGNIIRKAEKIVSLGAPVKDETRARISNEGDEDDESIDSSSPNSPSSLAGK